MARSRAPDIPDAAADGAAWMPPPGTAGNGAAGARLHTARRRPGAARREPDVLVVVRRASAPRIRRAIAACLIAYGAAGLAIALLAVLVLAEPIGRIGSLGTTLESQRAELVRTMEATRTVLDGASGTADRLGTSLDAARTGSASAASLARDLSGTMRDLSSAAGVNILGAQPLAGLQSGFSRAAGQLDSLGGQLDGIGAALVANRQDAASSRTEIAGLRDEVGSLVATIRDAELPSIGGSPLVAGLVVVALLLWLAIPALVSLVAGVVLWRSTRRRPVARAAAEA